MNPSAKHQSTEALLAYRLDDGNAAATEAADEHLMRCDACGARLDELIALGEGVRAAWRAGSIAAATTGAFIRRLADQGLRIREYRLRPGESVNCSAAPDNWTGRTARAASVRQVRPLPPARPEPPGPPAPYAARAGRRAGRSVSTT
jgi:hypothetical protein